MRHTPPQTKLIYTLPVSPRDTSKIIPKGVDGILLPPIHLFPISNIQQFFSNLKQKTTASILGQWSKTHAFPSGLASHLDYVIIRGINSPDDLTQALDTLDPNRGTYSQRHPSLPPNALKGDNLPFARYLLAIEYSAALEHLSILLDKVDGVYLDRKALGSNSDPYTIPVLQRSIMETCKQLGKMVIIDSEIMHSMVTQATPTRAEVNDLTEAVMQGADGMVLASDVTGGPHGDTAVEMALDTLQCAQEYLHNRWEHGEYEVQSQDDAIVFGALDIAEKWAAKAIVCVTLGGYTALRLSGFLPPVPIFALCAQTQVLRHLQLVRSVVPIEFNLNTQIEFLLKEIKKMLVTSYSFQPGDGFVFVSLSRSPIGENHSNMFTHCVVD